jgi:hypothetical protein
LRRRLDNDKIEGQTWWGPLMQQAVGGKLKATTRGSEPCALWRRLVLWPLVLCAVAGGHRPAGTVFHLADDRRQPLVGASYATHTLLV